MAKIDIEKLKTDGELDDKKIEKMQEDNPIVEALTSEEVAEMSIKLNREPYTDLPTRLPTMGKKPLPPDEHKHIGMYESKQTLYLLFANAYNKIMEKLEELETRIESLENP